VDNFVSNDLNHSIEPNDLKDQIEPNDRNDFNDHNELNDPNDHNLPDSDARLGGGYGRLEVKSQRQETTRKKVSQEVSNPREPEILFPKGLPAR